jgi:hypothetical protein
VDVEIIGNERRGNTESKREIVFDEDAILCRCTFPFSFEKPATSLA